MDKMELNYEKDINIDAQALDVEWLKQAELMRIYASHSALCKKEVDEAKEQLEAGRAEIEMDIRKAPETYGLGKITESAVSSTILLQEKYRELVKKYNEAKYENDMAVAAVRAVDQKKTALENLVQLLKASYFAGPKAPRDLSQEWGKEVEQKKSNQNVKIKKRKDAR